MERVASGFDFLEGLRWAPDDSLYFTDGAGIRRLMPDGEVETIMEGRSAGGILLHGSGGIVVSGPAIVHIVNKKVNPIFSAKKASGFKGFVTDKAGQIYAGSYILNRRNPTDLTKTKPAHCWLIPYRDSGKALYGDVGFPGGMAFSPDGRTVYQCDTFRRQIIRHTFREDGKLVAVPRISTASAPGVPDGLAVDEDGCLWLGMFEGGAVVRLTPDGRVDRAIEFPAKTVTSVCFGGSERTDLFVATCDNTKEPDAKGGIYVLQADTPGLAVAPARV